MVVLPLDVLGFLKGDIGEYLDEDLDEGAQRDVDGLFVGILERDLPGLFDVHLIFWVRSLMGTC